MGRSSIQEPARSPRHTGARAPLVQRKRAERRAARQLMAARTRQGLTAEQRAHDPLLHRRRAPIARGALLALLLLGAAAIHVGVVAVGFLIGGRERPQRERIEQTVKVEVREPPPPPPPPPPEEKRPEPPKPEPIAKKPPAPPPKAKAPPPEAPKGPPPRVVGISLDSTTEGGSGPAFATGDTHQGQTAERAAAPRPPQEAPAPAPAAAAPTVVKNQVASRIPVAGVQYTPPRRKRPHEPVYPETLKAQEIEADVGVLVSIDAAGKVTKVKVIGAAPYPEFNQAAEKAAREEEFEPALRDGVAIPYTLSYTYRFRLETK
jgi:protein TonB